jgi:hypothetical protein
MNHSDPHGYPHLVAGWRNKKQLLNMDRDAKKLTKIDHSPRDSLHIVHFDQVHSFFESATSRVFQPSTRYCSDPARHLAVGPSSIVLLFSAPTHPATNEFEYDRSMRTGPGMACLHSFRVYFASGYMSDCFVDRDIDQYMGV